MPPQRHWMAVVPEQTYARERLYAFATVELTCADADSEPPPGAGGDGPESRHGPPGPGDPVAIVAATEPPVLFALGRAAGFSYASAPETGRAEPGPVERRPTTIVYTHRLFDEPVPVPAELVDGSAPVPRLHPLTEAEFERLAARVGANHQVDAERARWLVSVALPIEARSAAEAVREFWTYVQKLGPAELPAYVWPRGDELAMQAFVLGDPANLDPEEDD